MKRIKKDWHWSLICLKIGFKNGGQITVSYPSSLNRVQRVWQTGGRGGLKWALWSHVRIIVFAGVSSYIRLRGGGRSDRGRVELYRSFQYGWYTACDHQWDLNDAKVVCRELGFTGASAVRLDAYYGQGNGLRITDMHPACKGTEPSLKNCSKISMWRTNCGHGDDVGVDCLPWINVSIIFSLKSIRQAPLNPITSWI